VTTAAFGIIMSIMTCKECGNIVSSKAELCPHCGFRMRKSVAVRIFGALLGIMLGVLMLYGAWAIASIQ
jgi:hypothetical protein